MSLNLENLILDYLPSSLDGFPLNEMAMVCEHCPFSNDDILPFERDRGRPVSDIYKIECEKNKLGRAVKRFPSKNAKEDHVR